MPDFPKPSFEYEYEVASEIEALRSHRQEKPGRNIPEKAEDRILIATWNIANLGAQDRREEDYRLIAELIRWFDLVALQEVKDDIRGLREIQKHLPASFRALFSDHAGNNERLAFLYDTDKVVSIEKVGEVAIPPSQKRYVQLPGIQQKFRGFDRNPYLSAFHAGSFLFVLVNVHLYFGSESKISMNRRSLENYAVARWADLRRKSKNAYTRDIIVLGDFNLPMAEPGDPIYDALTKRGLHLPKHSTKIWSNIVNDKQYDQIAFFPGSTQEKFTQRSGVFDFDGALFRTLWEQCSQTDFLAYMRYYISDHRMMWAEFQV
jgi:endonuclease/exonuclease/phosphatase family metal-dependent hydrolase